MQFYYCLKFGLIIKTCRGKSVCFHCGELQHPNLPCQSTTPTCANCKADDSLSPNEIDHVRISSKCPKMIEQKKINIQMAYENLSFVEAIALVVPKKNISSNANTVMKTKENFPTLDNAKSKIRRVSNQSNRTNIHKRSCKYL
uniref:CCHC-type domain-containing protein n=1 Tax=Trichogramma kaykai TaxID=54128 RepID=A0ABD2X0K1_9HYME